ncbi:hypothetical protein BDA99DRAFT_514748 [Phascolomyces articulosus]|uniref:Uncharacterized protein n=1 Tax=Phascolomyces articulosus TaxID=60185 RepID=A0AAD5JXW2_9FUNG|nr:hypothetical protein BDA99DRAFT_514748 [Phascolomyces articulosus]
MIPTLPDVDAIEQGSPNTKAIIGGVVGGAVGLGLAIAGIVFFMRRKKKRDRINQLQQQQRRLSSPMETGNSYDDDFYGDPYRHSLMSSNNEYGWSSSSNTNTSNAPLFTYDAAVEAYRNGAGGGSGGQPPPPPPPQQSLMTEQPIVARRPNSRGDANPGVDIPHYRD